MEAATAKRIYPVYAIVTRPDGKDLFLRSGTAFPNRDGSLTILLDALPLSGKLQVRDYAPKEQQAPRTDVEAQPRAREQDHGRSPVAHLTAERGAEPAHAGAELA